MWPSQNIRTLTYNPCIGIRIWIKKLGMNSQCPEDLKEDPILSDATINKRVSIQSNYSGISI